MECDFEMTDLLSDVLSKDENMIMHQETDCVLFDLTFSVFWSNNVCFSEVGSRKIQLFQSINLEKW